VNEVTIYIQDRVAAGFSMDDVRVPDLLVDILFDVAHSGNSVTVNKHQTPLTTRNQSELGPNLALPTLEDWCLLVHVRIQRPRESCIQETSSMKHRSTSTLRKPAADRSRTDAETLDEAVARLERDGARWRRGFAVTAALLAVLVLGGAGHKLAVPDRLAAESFVLVDRDGNVRGEWRLSAIGPEFASYDADGSLVGVVATTGGSTVAPRPEAGEASGRIILGAPPASESDNDDFDWIE
jgi:hypothetical protein